MKKIYLSLMLFIAGFTAHAQRTIGVVVDILYPTTNLEILKDDIVSPVYTLRNLGPDTIYVTDTIKIQHSGLPAGQYLDIWYTVNIEPNQVIVLDELRMGKAKWNVPFDNIRSLFNTDNITKKIAKPYTDDKKYAWYFEVTDVKPSKASGTTIFFNSSLSMDTVHVRLKWPTSIEEAASAKIETLVAYPNPASDQLSFNVALTGTDQLLARIVDAGGRVVAVKKLDKVTTQEQKYTLDISTLPAGNYMLQLEAGEKMMMSKFSVQK